MTEWKITDFLVLVSSSDFSINTACKLRCSVANLGIFSQDLGNFFPPGIFFGFLFFKNNLGINLGIFLWSLGINLGNFCNEILE